MSPAPKRPRAALITGGARGIGLASGRRLGFGRACGRFGAKFLSYWLGLLGWLPMFFGQRRQALHDRLCGTLVLRRPPQPRH